VHAQRLLLHPAMGQNMLNVLTHQLLLWQQSSKRLPQWRRSNNNVTAALVASL
jgi:hypothetical protein